MAIVKRVVCISDTDCTKALYFTSLLKFVQEAFERQLREEYTGVEEMFRDGKLVLPIVSTTAEFLSPIHVGDLLEIHLTLECFNTSFEVKGDVFHEGKRKGSVTIKHVCVDPTSKKRLLSKELFHALSES